jgi:hypothetical protein
MANYMKEPVIIFKKNFLNNIFGNSVIQNERTQKCSAWLNNKKHSNSHDFILEIPALSFNSNFPFYLSNKFYSVL